jgi:hypothetical protein
MNQMKKGDKMFLKFKINFKNRKVFILLVALSFIGCSSRYSYNFNLAELPVDKVKTCKGQSKYPSIALGKAKENCYSVLNESDRYLYVIINEQIECIKGFCSASVEITHQSNLAYPREPKVSDDTITLRIAEYEGVSKNTITLTGTPKTVPPIGNRVFKSIKVYATIKNGKTKAYYLDGENGTIIKEYILER